MLFKRKGDFEEKMNDEVRIMNGRQNLPLPFIIQHSSFNISKGVAPFAVREFNWKDLKFEISNSQQFIPEARVGSNRESDPAYLPIRQHTGPLDKRPSMRDQTISYD